MPLLDKYEPGDFFDEMFSTEGEVRPHYALLGKHFVKKIAGFVFVEQSHGTET